jgi:K+/H+ antiporter YhaU regulatory subunit KhtT
MVVELKEVISKVELLGDEEQKQIAKLLEDEMQWDITLQKTQNQLSNLANEALHEYNAGNTKQEELVIEI